MKRPLRVAILFAMALTIAALLPLYIERTMTHVMFADGSGGAIEWGWKRCTLRSYWANYPYMRREQKPTLWLGVNIALAFSYASVTAFAGRLLIRRKAAAGSSTTGGATPINRCRERDEAHEGHRGHLASSRSSLRDDDLRPQLTSAPPQKMRSECQCTCSQRSGQM